MTQATIGLARLGDAPRIAQMSRTLIEAGLPWNWTPRRVAAMMRQRECVVLVARAQQELAGFVIAQFGAQAVHVALLGVAEAYRRQGIARQLIHWVEDSALVAGLFQVRLEVRRINRGAQRFYAMLGYSQQGTMRGYYSGLEDAICLVRDLRVGADRQRNER
jgi:ribosomal-protein-alanine N-acetyltransferase